MFGAAIFTRQTEGERYIVVLLIQGRQADSNFI